MSTRTPRTTVAAPEDEQLADLTAQLNDTREKLRRVGIESVQLRADAEAAESATQDASNALTDALTEAAMADTSKRPMLDKRAEKLRQTAREAADAELDAHRRAQAHGAAHERLTQRERALVAQYNARRAEVLSAYRDEHLEPALERCRAAIVDAIALVTVDRPLADPAFWLDRQLGLNGLTQRAFTRRQELVRSIGGPETLTHG